MFTRLLQRLFRRSKPAPVCPAMAAWLLVESQRQSIACDIAEDPAMCRPAISVPTRHITRWLADDDEPTVADDWEETRTMETVLVGR